MELQQGLGGRALGGFWENQEACPGVKREYIGMQEEKKAVGTSPAVQWLRLPLPMQGLQV